MTRWCYIHLLGFILVSSSNILGQGFSYHRYYAPEDYDGHTQNWAAEQDTNGIIHIGNGSGLLSFNGVEWIENHIGESGRGISFYKVQDGTMYVNGSTDFGIIAPDSLNRISYSSISEQFYMSNEIIPIIWNVYEINNQIYYSHTHGIAVYSPINNTLQDYQLNNETILPSFQMGDSIIVDAESGLWTFHDSTFTQLSNDDVFSDYILHFSLKMDEKTFLLGGRNSGNVYRLGRLWTYDGETIKPFPSEAEVYLNENWPYDAIRVDEQTIAIATIYGGVVFINNDGELLKIFNERTGLYTNAVYDLFLDHEKNVWLNLSVGIQKLNLNESILHFTETAGIDGTITDIEVAGENIFLYAFPDVYVSKILQPENVITFQEVKLDKHFAGFVKKNDRVFMYGNDGIFSLNKLGIDSQVYKAPVTQEVEAGFNLAEMDFLGPKKLISYNGSSIEENLTNLDQEIGFAVRYKEQIYVTLGHKTAGKEIAVVDKDSLINLPIRYDSSNVFSINKLGILNGKLFIGAEGGGDNSGLYEFNSKEGAFIKSEFLADHPDFNAKQIFNFVQCSNGDIWVDANNKLFKVIKEDEGWVAKSAPYQLVGKNSPPFAINCTEDGIWLGSIKKLTFISNEEWDYETQFKTNITGLYVRNDSLIYGGYGKLLSDITLPYRDNELRFTFAAASYISPEDNQYQVKLEGFDHDWSTWTSETQKDYTNIPEGNYTFKVRSKNVYEVAGFVDSISFQILPPWYRTWWAYVLYTFTIAALLYIAYKIRVNQLLRVERIRNNIASDLHDEVSATLSSISYFAQAIDSDQVKGDKNKFVKLIYNSSVDAKEKISDIVWAINPEHDNWKAFLSKCRRFASDLLESKNIKYSLKIDEDIPAKLDMQLRQHLWLIFKEMITNSARHSNAKNLDVIINYEDRSLKMVVQDDGVGMDVDKVKKGNGLVNIQKRVDLIKGVILLRTDKNFGTRWTLKVPL